jgi:serine/threonine protein phosphatase PrpC
LNINPLISSNIAARLASWFMRKTGHSGIRRIASLNAAISTDIGLTRDANEDRVAICKGYNLHGQPYVLAALCDGIGGMKEGATCAALAVGHLFSSLAEQALNNRAAEEVLRHAVSAANEAVHHRFEAKGGCTLSAVLLTGPGRGYLANVGDSRIYRYTEGQLLQLTVDDTIAGQLGRKRVDDVGTQLIQYIGIGNSLEIHVAPLEIAPTDSVLLCSDGIHYVDGKWLSVLLQHATDPGAALKRLTDTATWLGGRDNASAALLSPQGAVPAYGTRLDACAELDVWDAFGEVQIFLDRNLGYRPATYASPRSSVEPDEVAEVRAKPGIPSTRPTAKTTKPKKKRERKSKSGSGKGAKSTAAGASKGGAPQLRIDFPKKG